MTIHQPMMEIIVKFIWKFSQLNFDSAGEKAR